MTALIWTSKIHPNFKTLLDTTLTGSLYNTLRDSGQSDLVNTLSSSLYNGAYSLQVGGIRGVNIKVNGVLDYEYEVLLQVGYEVSNDDARVKYNKAINDIETIIKYRLNTTTYEGTLLTVSLGSVRKPQSAKTNTFLIIEVPFIVTGRIFLS